MSSVRRTGSVSHELTRMVERNNGETDKILDTIDPWFRYREHLPNHLGARLLVDTTAHIFTEFPTLDDAIDFDEKIRRAIGLKTKKDEARTLSDDASASVSPTVV